MKLTESSIKKYVQLSEKIKKLEKEKYEIAKEIKKRGTFSTQNYNISVEVITRENSPSLKILQALISEQQYKQWIEDGYITFTSYDAIRVKKKA